MGASGEFVENNDFVFADKIHYVDAEAWDVAVGHPLALADAAAAAAAAAGMSDGLLLHWLKYAESESGWAMRG